MYTKAELGFRLACPGKTLNPKPIKRTALSFGVSGLGDSGFMGLEALGFWFRVSFLGA